MVTVDTNIAVYALTLDDKRFRAREVLKETSFLSVQVLDEYANTARRKLRRDWPAIAEDLASLRNAVNSVRPILNESNLEAVRIAARYQLQFYDALMIAVALENGATILYSEDMQHGLVIDGTLTIANPFVEAA